MCWAVAEVERIEFVSTCTNQSDTERGKAFYCSLNVSVAKDKHKLFV